MEYFKIKYADQYSPRRTKIFMYTYASTNLILGVLRLIEKQYFYGTLFILCAATMFITQYLTEQNIKKGNELPFVGLVIDTKKRIIYGKGLQYGSKEILLDDIQCIKLNTPYNDTLEINTKDRKVTRFPLYWFGQEDQKKIKELLNDYMG